MTPSMQPSAGVSPVLVATMRGLVYAVVIAAGGAVVAFTQGLDAESLGDYAWALPFLAVGARALEGVVDRLRGQAPQLPAGSKPADPAGYITGPLPGSAELAAVGHTVEPLAVAVTVQVAARDVSREQVWQAVTDAMPRSNMATRDRVTDHVLTALAAP